MSSVKAACFAMLVLASVQRTTAATTACDNETSVYCTTWIMNTGDEFSTAPFLDNVLTDVQAVEVDGDYLRIVASGIPKFTTVISNEIFEFLESRPKASSDFENGVPSVSVGDLVEWGGDVGYTGKQGCAAGSSGYWPTGPSCPSDQNLTAYIPMQPTFTESVCYQPLGNIGLFSNGVAVYGLLDGTSYNSEGTWNSLAPKFEIYDVDINGGHAQTSGQYHIHATTNMMPALKGENNSDAKSSVWGFAADGFPILGPYIADGVEAQSCWKARNYFNDSLGGCGTEGERSCLLVDIFDLSQGTVSTSLVGPNVQDNVTTQSGNTISGESGIYLEDFYYDAACTAQGDEYLDEHNGRMDDELGYVYHMTSSFPYNLGPTFKGKLHANGLVSSCQTSSTASSGSSSSTSSSSTRTSRPTMRPSRSSKPSASRETSASDDDDDGFESAETMSPSDATRSLPQMMAIAVLVTLMSLR